MKVAVTRVTAREGSETWEGSGTAENGEHVWFDGPWRTLQDLADLIEQQGVAVHEIDESQITCAEIPHSPTCTCLDCSTERFPPSNAR